MTSILFPSLRIAYLLPRYSVTDFVPDGEIRCPRCLGICFCRACVARGAAPSETQLRKRVGSIIVSQTSLKAPRSSPIFSRRLDSESTVVVDEFDSEEEKPISTRLRTGEKDRSWLIEGRGGPSLIDSPVAEVDNTSKNISGMREKNRRVYRGEPSVHVSPRMGIPSPSPSRATRACKREAEREGIFSYSAYGRPQKLTQKNHAVRKSQDSQHMR